MISFLAAQVFAQTHWGMDWNQAGWFWMTLMMIGGAILVVVVVYLLIRPYYGHMAGSRQSNGSPLDIAKRRYASGEITAEEYEKIKGDIGGT